MLVRMSMDRLHLRVLLHLGMLLHLRVHGSVRRVSVVLHALLLLVGRLLRRYLRIRGRRTLSHVGRLLLLVML